MRTLFFALLLFSLSFAQNDPEIVLRALNKQVEFMNANDQQLHRLYVQMVDLNAKMLAWQAGEKAQDFSFECNFSPSEEAYKRATYQNLYLPQDARAGILKDQDSLMAIMRRIGSEGKKLENYLNTQGYNKDDMKEGFVHLNALGKNSRSFLVAFVRLEASLRNTWHNYYTKGLGKSTEPIVQSMMRANSLAHTIYLDLGWDPQSGDHVKHLEELNQSLANLKTRFGADARYKDSPAFNAFVQPFEADYFAEYNPSLPADFLKKYNEGYVQDVNKRIIRPYNQFLSEQKILALQAIEETPFFVAKLPVEPAKPVVVATKAPESSPKTVETPPSPAPTPVVAPKEAALTGYAYNNLLFLIDVSGSMRDGGRLDTFKAAFRYILNEMRPEDKVSIVTYSGNARLLLKPTSAASKNSILQVINSLTSDGKSNLSAGLDMAYSQLNANKIEGGNNRVVIVTDGIIPLPPEIEQKVTQQAETIRTSLFLFGNEADPLIKVDALKAIASKGKGNYTVVGKNNARTAMLTEARAVKLK